MKQAAISDRRDVLALLDEDAIILLSYIAVIFLMTAINEKCIYCQGSCFYQLRDGSFCNLTFKSGENIGNISVSVFVKFIPSLILYI